MNVLTAIVLRIDRSMGRELRIVHEEMGRLVELLHHLKDAR